MKRAVVLQVSAISESLNASVVQAQAVRDEAVRFIQVSSGGAIKLGIAGRDIVSRRVAAKAGPMMPDINRIDGILPMPGTSNLSDLQFRNTDRHKETRIR